MTHRMTPIQENYPSRPGDFVVLVSNMQANAMEVLFGFVWAGFDELKARGFTVKRANANVERGYTQQLAQCIRDVMQRAGGFLPYYLEHHPFEDETMMSAQACPKAPDLAFVWRANPRTMLPLEAKHVESDGSVAEYVKDINLNFLASKYAPFSSQGGMLAYLRSGVPSNLFRNIGRSLGKRLNPAPSFPMRSHAYSDHVRKVKTRSGYATRFRCHHLVLPIQ